MEPLAMQQHGVQAMAAKQRLGDDEEVKLRIT